jgi:hypothetical protein
MSRLIMWNLVTLDGYFEGAKSWDLDWHESVWGRSSRHSRSCNCVRRIA